MTMQNSDPGDLSLDESRVVTPTGWSMSLLRRVRQSRTGFSRYVSRCVCAIAGTSRSQYLPPGTDLFPLPLPYPDAHRNTGESPVMQTARQRQRLALQTSLNVLVLAMNFVYNGRQVPRSVQHAWRHPNASQAVVLRRLEMFSRSWARDSTGVSFSSSRKGPTQCGQLRDVLRCAFEVHKGLDPYGQQGPRSFGGSAPRMCPLDAAKLKFGEGLGQFPLAQWLPAGLALALLEPKTIKQLLADPTNWHWPPTDDLRPSVLVPLMAKLAAALASSSWTTPS